MTSHGRIRLEDEPGIEVARPAVALPAERNLFRGGEPPRIENRQVRARGEVGGNVTATRSVTPLAVDS